MKIIFSRKGVDSSAGGFASVILPDEQIHTIPIPEKPKPGSASKSCYSYDDLLVGNGITAGKLVKDLAPQKIKPTDKVHLDPDLDFNSVARLTGWKPILGQAGAAEGHLRKQQVKCGDIFVFFGWFRNVTLNSGNYRYQSGDNGQHVIFGWLQIEKRLDMNNRGDISKIPVWASSHPHTKIDKGTYKKQDSIYIAKEFLNLPNLAKSIPGAGVFKNYSAQLCLTDIQQANQNKKRGLWRLPAWFYPDDDKPALTYHPKKYWTKDDTNALVERKGPGQEFVLDTYYYPDAINWLCKLLEENV